MKHFIWNDGGRFAAGYVGLAGDCVSRAIALGTGLNYRAVYQELGERARKTPRNGLPAKVGAEFLIQRGWQEYPGDFQPFETFSLGEKIGVFYLMQENRKHPHFTTVMDDTLYDTWNPAEDEYFVDRYWLAPAELYQQFKSGQHPHLAQELPEEMSQQQFEKILRRLQALDRTATNQASTDGEKRNALRMMQAMMLRHNLSREDIGVQDNDGVQFARVSCLLNGRKSCGWEYLLAGYLCEHIFPMVQYYGSRSAHRTRFMFYGPCRDTQNAVELFRELLVTIAAAARLQYGGHSRGSGASYAEGYVRGLPREAVSTGQTAGIDTRSRDVIQTKILSLKKSANAWLKEETGVCIIYGQGGGRSRHDSSAAALGRQHGATHEIKNPDRPKRLT
jgi:hypothetical protein